MSDDPTGIAEKATFCKVGDDKRPGLVPANPNGPEQVCPDDLSMGVDEATDASPVGWYVRIQFDELLNPDRAEDLVPITDAQGKETGLFRGTLANTQPVTIHCGGIEVPYDGYYDPSGNVLTWPVAPALFIAPVPDTSKIAAGTECDITLSSDQITDKDGVKVPAGQLGPYKFKIAELAVASTSPEALKDPTMPPAMPTMISPMKALSVKFNATINVASLLPAEVKIRSVASCDDPGGTARDAVLKADPDDKTSIVISDGGAAPAVDAGNAWLASTTYVVTFNTGSDVQDLAGASLSLPGADTLLVCFQTTDM